MSSTQQGADTPLVDTHFHLYTRDMPLTSWAWHHPPADATAEDFIALMDRHGVGFGVVAAASLHGQYNDYVIRALRRHPRLRGTAFLRPDTDMYTMERMKADGIVGIRLFFRRVPDPPDLRSPEYRLLLRRVRDLDWHVHTLVASPMLPEVIAAVEDAGVKLVIDHFGRPDAALGVHHPGFAQVLALGANEQVWLKVSGLYRLGGTDEQQLAFAREAMPLLEQRFSAQRLVWGSDWPHTQHEHHMSFPTAVAQLEALGYSSPLRQALLIDAPRVLFGF